MGYKGYKWRGYFRLVVSPDFKVGVLFNMQGGGIPKIRNSRGRDTTACSINISTWFINQQGLEL